MKKILLFVCVIALVLGLCGCGDQTPQGTETPNPDVSDADTTKTPQHGDLIDGMTRYFDDVPTDSLDEVMALVDRYGFDDDGTMRVWYEAKEYSGFIESSYGECYVYKRTTAWAESVMFFADGSARRNREEFDENGVLVFSHVASPEADYYVDTYYNGNVERHEFIGLDGTVREVKEYDKGEDYHVLTYVKYKGGEQWFTYADKANKVLATMRVVEDNGMDYTFTLDGAGHNPENVLSMTLTQNGTTVTYGQGSIPWYSVASPPGRMPRG